MSLLAMCRTAWRMRNRFSWGLLLCVASSAVLALPALQRLPEIYRTEDGIQFQVEVVAEGLRVPWDMEFTQAGQLIMTQRQGYLLLLDTAGGLRELDQLPQVLAKGESGLMGMAIHAASRDQQYIYLCYSVQKGLFGTRNKLTRSMLGRFGLLQEKELLSWAGDRFHNGCQVAIGPDRKLYVSTGDATEGKFAQRQDSLLGKLLRLNLDGSIPADNPSPGSPVYTLGHRNPQGLDWHPRENRLYSVEHGPSGFDGPRGGDELNRIEAGNNYGWPPAGDSNTESGGVAPLLVWDQSIAPAGMVVYRGNQFPQFNNNLFITSLIGEALIRVVVDEQGDPVAREPLLKGRFGRLRAITLGSDGYLYFATSNHDGRGDPGGRDDRLLRLVPPG